MFEGREDSFRETLMQAAREARKAKTISLAEFIFIAGASRSPKMLAEIMSTTKEIAHVEDTAFNGSNWSDIFKLLLENLPAIIKILLLIIG